MLSAQHPDLESKEISNNNFENMLRIFWRCLNWKTDFIELNELIDNTRAKFLNLLHCITSSSQYPLLNELKNAINYLVETGSYKKDEVAIIIADIESDNLQLANILKNKYQNKVSNFIADMNEYIRQFETKAKLPEKIRTGFSNAGVQKNTLNHKSAPIMSNELGFVVEVKVKKKTPKEKTNIEKLIARISHKRISKKITLKTEKPIAIKESEDNNYKQLLHAYYQSSKSAVLERDYDKIKYCAIEGLEVSKRIHDKDKKDMQAIQHLENILSDELALIIRFLNINPTNKWLELTDPVNNFINHLPENLGILLNNLPESKWSSLRIIDIQQVIKTHDDFIKFRQAIDKEKWGSLRFLFENTQYLSQESVRWLNGFKLCHQISDQLKKSTLEFFDNFNEFSRTILESFKSNYTLPENSKFKECILVIKQFINECSTSSIRTKDNSSHNENYFEGIALQYTMNFIKNMLAMTATQKIVFCSVKNDKESNKGKQRLFSVKTSNEYKKEIATSIASLRS